ncbi:MAG: transposase [Candidatus Levyibacteriota bacterium]
MLHFRKKDMHIKQSINGTHHAVSPKHLQLYVDEFS